MSSVLPTAIPNGWERLRFDRVVRRSKESGKPDFDPLSVYLEAGVVPRASREDNHNQLGADMSNYLVVRPGDIVFNKLRTWQGGLGVSRHQGVVSPAYFVCRPVEDIESRYYHYLLRSHVYLAELTRLSKFMPPSQFDIAWDDLRTLSVPVPPLAEQRAIADYLDAETARIDALITKKRRMIGLLEARFGSYIRERLSEVGPTIPLKRRWSVIDCKHRTPTYVDHGYPVISPGDVTAGRLDLGVAHRFVGDEDYQDLAGGTRRAKSGDIIYSRNASIGIAGYVDTDEPFCMGQDVCLVTSPDQNQLYLTYVLNSIGLDQLDVQKIGSTFSRVNISQILEIQVPTPAPARQHELAVEFDAQRTHADKMIAVVQKQTGLLQERRQALITAAVTGERKILGVAA